MFDTTFSGHSIFAIRNFRYFVVGRFGTAIATHIQTIGVGLYVYYLTRDPLALGLSGLFTFLPQLLFVAVAGHVADSYDRRLVSALSYLVAAASAAILFMLVRSEVQWVGWFYMAIALVGLSRVFGQPANQAMVANLVGREQLPTAVAWAASVTQTATILGPALGGFLYLLGPEIVFATAALGHTLAATAIFRISPQREAGEPREPFSFDAFTKGAGFILSSPVLFGALSLDLVGVLFAGVVALLPIYATDILDAGPQGLGWLRTSQAVGALGMALFLARHPIKERVGVWLFSAAAIFGLSIIGFGLSRILLLSMLFMMIEGASDMVSVVVRTTLIQNETPDAMRGRVSSVNALFIGASNSLGDFESGLAARLFGVVPATIGGGIISLLTTALWMRLFPQLLRREKL